MSTVQVLHDEIESFDADAAEKFKNEMVAAMMEAPLKNFTSLRGVASAWADKRDHLKKMATDPAYRAMVAQDFSERYGIELPVEAEVTVLATEGDADEDETAETADEAEPSFA